MNIRGGTALIWGNAYDAAYPAGFTLSYYRSAQDLGFVGAKCDGTCSVDQNSDATGYRCQQQPGSTGDDGLTQAPVVAWDNDAAGTSMGFGLNSNFMPPIYDAVPNETDHVKEERDYLSDATCSDGVDNDGNGATDMEDPTCVAFWDDAQDKAVGYLPYEYPHPLRTDGVGGASADESCGAAGAVGGNADEGGGDSGCGCKLAAPGLRSSGWWALGLGCLAGLRRPRACWRKPTQ
jgi:hypothetical protein